LFWKVELDDNRKLELKDTRRKTGTYVLRIRYLERVAALKGVETVSSDNFKIFDPKNAKKSNKYYALSHVVKENKNYYALLEIGYGGCRIVAVTPELETLEGDTIIDFFEQLIKDEKIKGTLIVGDQFIVKLPVNK